MTHYYYDPKTNTLHGPLTQEYPEMTGNQMLDEDNLVEFWNHVRSCPSHPHTFSGPSRVVPEGEIEWQMEVWYNNKWNVIISEMRYDGVPENKRRRVATPSTQAPGYTSTSGEDGYNPKYYSYEETGGGTQWDERSEVEQLKYQINKLQSALVVSLNTSKRRREKIEALTEPLTAQPDKPEKVWG